jgi:sialic acid synthase SpsE
MTVTVKVTVTSTPENFKEAARIKAGIDWSEVAFYHSKSFEPAHGSYSNLKEYLAIEREYEVEIGLRANAH